MPENEVVYRVGDDVEYLSTTYGNWIPTKVVEVKRHGAVVKLACKATAKLSEGKVRKPEQALEREPVPSGHQKPRRPSSMPTPSTGSRSRVSNGDPQPEQAAQQTLRPGEFFLGREEEQAHRDRLQAVAPAEVRMELVRDRRIDPIARRAEAAASIASRIPTAATLPGRGFAYLAGKREKMRRELALRKSEEEDKEKARHLKRSVSDALPNDSRRSRHIVRTPPPPVRVPPKMSTFRHSKEKTSRDNVAQRSHSQRLVARTAGKTTAVGDNRVKAVTCTSRRPQVGDLVRDNTRQDVEDKVSFKWMLRASEVATVTEVDADFDFILRNPRGEVTERPLLRKFFEYVPEEEAASPRAPKASKTESARSWPCAATPLTPAMTPCPDEPSRAETEPMRKRRAADEIEPPAKKARAKPKTQAKPKPAPSAPSAASASSAPAPAPAAASTAPAPLQPLGKEAKQELQNKIDLLEDDFLETVLRFLEEDLGGDDDEELNLDLDKLAPHRQHQVVKVVDDELAKQRARQEAHARGDRTPPESPIFDIGKDILTPLQSHTTAPMGPMMSPLQLEPAAASSSKPATFAPFPTPTPFPTPSECGEEQTEGREPPTPQRLPVGQSPQLQALAAPIGRAAGVTGQSVGKLMVDTISRQVRKAVKATPELTESKTPRQHGPASSHSDSPKMRAPDSMLDILDEADVLALAEELPGGAKALDAEAGDARIVADKEVAASGAGISGISGESA